MPLPVHATVQAAQSYVLSVRTACEFLLQQDAANADARYAALFAQPKNARDLLRWNPTSGRPARFLAAKWAQGRALASRARAMAEAHGVPELRDLVVKPCALLYAQSAVHVVLLALKQERQLSFQLSK
jgi:hypothetical protein